MDEHPQPITGWSTTLIGISGEWPAYVDLGEPYDPNKYREVREVELKVKEAYGDGLSLHWRIEENGSATYVVRGGCGENTYSCKLLIYAKTPIDEDVSTSSGMYPLESAMLLADPPSIDVILSGTDKYGNTDFDTVRFVFSEPPPISDNLFSDVPGDYWAAEAINYMGENGYVTGRTDTGDPIYDPEAWITRAEVAVVLVRSDSEIEGYTPENPPYESVFFQDLESTLSVMSTASSEPSVVMWWTKWVEKLRMNGDTSGCSSDPPLYCPNSFVSRAQMATFAVKILYEEGFMPVQPASTSFRDVPYQDAGGNLDWRVKWIEQALSDHLIQDCGTDMATMIFRPDEAATRAEMACMVYNALMERDGQ